MLVKKLVLEEESFVHPDKINGVFKEKSEKKFSIRY
jgi:hypothetical protein